MPCARLIRALAALSLAASLLLIPAAVNAAPRADRGGEEGSPTLVVRVWDWLSSIWGAGGGGWDPSGANRPDPEPTPAPAPVITGERAAAALSAPPLADIQR